MSRIGKLPITIPAGVALEIEHGVVKATGPKGTNSQRLPGAIKVEQADGKLKVMMPTKKEDLVLWGLTRTLLANLVMGVANGFEKQLEIHGVGYRAQLEGDKLVLALGFSHPIEYQLPTGVTGSVEANLITLKGFDKQQVGQAAAKLRSFRPPEPYKGKGLRYAGEVVRRKVGKTAGKVAA